MLYAICQIKKSVTKISYFIIRRKKGKNVARGGSYLLLSYWLLGKPIVTIILRT